MLNFSYPSKRWCSKQLYTIPRNVIAKEKLLLMSGTSLESTLGEQEMEMVFSLRFRCLGFRGVSSPSNTSTEFILQVTRPSVRG